MTIKNVKVVLLLLVALAFTLLTGCSSDDDAPTTSSLLSANDLNLIFVVSPDVANDPLGDINPATGNLNNQGLQRSLQMGTYLHWRLLSAGNVRAIHVLEPMTHLQTANSLPDMAAIGFVQQFALLNRFTMGGTTGNSFPLGTSYGQGSVPPNVFDPGSYPHNCQGLVFNDSSGDNLALVTRIINANAAGFYVLSAPWDTTHALMADIARTKGYNLDLPSTYLGPNLVHVISITPSGAVSLQTFDSKLNPPATYPVLPGPVGKALSSQQPFFNVSRTGGVNGAVIPPGMNTNETVYMIRHAEAHPTRTFDDGNYVGQGQWRALDLPNVLPTALRGLPSPTVVYSIDPAQSFNFLDNTIGLSYVRPSLTVLPYAIANNLPLKLAASFWINVDASDATAAQNTIDFFFTSNNSAGVNLSNQTVLLAWEHAHFAPLVTALLQRYSSETVPSFTWPPDDYDTIWTVMLDAQGNVTVHNALCEGIDSASLPASAPQYF